eukprot:2808468-Prymnesium_polylepis.1
MWARRSRSRAGNCMIRGALGERSSRSHRSSSPARDEGQGGAEVSRVRCLARILGLGRAVCHFWGRRAGASIGCSSRKRRRSR